ncbi:MAG: mannose-1-phosphate guanylyltransferase/mannose-6-phosphate isomerase [Ferrovum sp.]|nr:mannose-1-phosphate guanylyltransferase/mannose-6-phosphate isomerase [Ferrovum sp.]NDU87260.1 mannose-1-phosphate guanylyltransferase/mannose-6-phosphate isomerase [Ferrovum sp.]
MHSVVPVILCGGSGTRLWPLSRAGFPKQFLALTGEESLFQQAALRAQALADADIQLSDLLLVMHEDHRFLARDQLDELRVGGNGAHFLLEPMARNTAPALTLAAMQALEHGEDPILVVAPADQTVGCQEVFIDALRRSIREAATGAIVILGIPPERAETGYGYIRRGGEANAHGAYTVVQFAEKPDAVTAQSYVDSGDYAWNSGLFVLSASLWLEALEAFRPDILHAVQRAWDQRTIDVPFIRPDKNCFMDVPSDSVDYAVMEHCPNSAFPIRMIPLQAKWNDLGAWDAVYLANEADGQGNVTQGDTLLMDTSDTLVHATHRLVSTVGVNHLIVVETPDAVLVVDRSKSQQVKQVVAALQQQKREEHNLHRKVHRPWGWYDSIDEGERFKVKRIQVKPKASLSLQMHYHRAEHWIVVQGTAEVTCGEKTFLLHENQSTYIPQGEVHRLANPGTIPLEIIEVQSGGYLGEDDIVRFGDVYGRQ